MATTWIVAADAARARLLQWAEPGKHLTEVEDLVNPDARMSNRELTADAHPRFHGSSGPGSDRQEISAGDHAEEMFAKRVAERLEQARQQHRYDELQLAAAPHFLGLLRKELSKEVRKLVTHEVPKDLSKLDTRELGERLK
jgi:protein required for attachment to host cells